MSWFQKAYYLLRGCMTRDLNKKWVLHIYYNIFTYNLCQWLKKKRKCMAYAFLKIWRKPSEHSTNCYFCMTPPTGKRLFKEAVAVCAITKHSISYSLCHKDKMYLLLMHQHHSTSGRLRQ